MTCPIITYLVKILDITRGVDELKGIIKCIIVTLFVLMFTNVTYAAGDYDLIRGKEMISKGGGKVTNPYGATDGNDTTFSYLAYKDTLYINFDSLSDVKKYRLHIKGSSGKVSNELRFLDSKGNVVYQQDYEATRTTLEKFEKEVELSAISTVEIQSKTIGVHTQIYTFEVFGTPSQLGSPTNFKAQAKDGQSTLTWDEVGAAEGYNVYHNQKKIASTTNNSYNVTTTNNTDHYFYVTSYKSDLESLPSITVKIHFDNIPPKSPNLLAESLSNGNIRLYWTKPNDRDELTFKVYQDDQLINTTKNQTLTLDQVAYGQTYRFKVIALDSALNEGESNTVTITAQKPRDTIPPIKPVNLKGTAEYGYISLSWKANSENDLAGYYVYVNGAKYGDLTTDNKINIYGLNSNTSYRFRVAAVDDSGNVSQLSDEITVKTLQPTDTTPPASPRNLTAALAGNYLSILLSWGAVNESDVIGYYVYVSDDDLIYKQVNSNPISTTGYSFTEIEGNKTYYFKVAAVDQSGNISERTKSVSVNVPHRDPKEDVSKKKEMLVTWNEIKGAVNYLIYFNGVLIATTDNQTFKYVIGEEHGYTGQMSVNVQVKARFEDGSTGYDSNLGTQSKFGFSAQDLWKAVMYILGSVASIFLLSLAVKLAPKAFNLIKKSVNGRRS